MNLTTYQTLSEELASYIDKENGVGQDNDYIAYATMSDEKANEWRHMIIDELGYYLAPSQLFENAEPADYAANARSLIRSADGSWNEKNFYQYEDWALSTDNLA